MNLFRAFRSELIKVRHTSFWSVHIGMPVIGALLFTVYHLLYDSTADEKKLQMMLELTATVFPLLIGIIVSLNVASEEKVSLYSPLLGASNRQRLLAAKLTFLYGAGVLALFGLFLLFLLSARLLGIAGAICPKTLLLAASEIACSNLIIYILHLFLSLKFGLGLSLFCGVFESLQCILYSNIDLTGVARYIPFAWSINRLKDVLHDRLLAHRAERIVTILLTIGGLLLLFLWFSRWEGRRNKE